MPRQVFFGRDGTLKPAYCFQAPDDSLVHLRFFGKRAVLGTREEWFSYAQACAAKGLPLDSLVSAKQAQLRPLVASEEIVSKTVVVTKPLPGLTPTDSTVDSPVVQHVSVTHQQGYHLSGEQPSPNAGVAVTAMRLSKGRKLFRSRSETRSVGALRSRELSLGPKSRSHMEKAEAQVDDPTLRSRIRWAQFGRNEIPGELFVP